MKTDIYPAGQQAPGNTTFLWLGKTPPSSPPTVAQLTGPEVLDITCYLMAEDVEIGMEQERTDDTRACHSAKSESFGAVTYSRESIRHVVAPQGAGTEQGNLALGSIEANATQYCAVVMGLKHGTAPEQGTRVDIYKVTTGAAHISPLSSGNYLRTVNTSWTKVQDGVAVAS